MAWEVEFSDEFGEWWNSLTAAEQKSVDFTVEAFAPRRSSARALSLLQQAGPALKMPHSSGVTTSRHTHMRELRIQHEGLPYRVLYAFDPRRTAMLLIGGDKTGNNRWYEQHVPIADAIYDLHLQEVSASKPRTSNRGQQ